MLTNCNDAAQQAINLVKAASKHFANTSGQGHLADSEVLSWLQTAQDFDQHSPATSLSGLGPDWESTANIRFILKHCAAKLAQSSGLSTPIVRSLNHFVNAPPLAHHSGSYVYSREPGGSRLRHWRLILLPVAGQSHLKFLHLAEKEGLAACWQLDHILTQSTSRLFCDAPKEPLISEWLIFKHNVAASRASHQLRLLPRNMWRTTRSNTLFDHIYLDGLDRKTTLAQDLQCAFLLLAPGGTLDIDSYNLQMCPIWSALTTFDPRRTTDPFLKAVAGQYEVIALDYQITIRKL